MAKLHRGAVVQHMVYLRASGKMGGRASDALLEVWKGIPAGPPTNGRRPVLEGIAVSPTTVVSQLPERVKIPAADGVISRSGHVALGPMLDGVPGVVERGSLRALRS